MYSKLLHPPFSRYRCSVFINPAFFKSFIARWTVDSESFRSLAMVEIAGQQMPELLALADR